MNEYLIEVLKNNEVTHVVTIQGDKSISLNVASETNYKYASKFKNKERAVKVAEKIDGARVVPSFGGYVNSTKTIVAPIRNKVNKSHFYKSI